MSEKAIDDSNLNLSNFGKIIKACKIFLIESFEIEERKTTLGTEIFAGYIHFISCLFVLPVIPNQLAAAGYAKASSIQATAISSAVGCMLSSYITNLPFIV